MKTLSIITLLCFFCMCTPISSSDMTENTSKKEIDTTVQIEQYPPSTVNFEDVPIDTFIVFECKNDLRNLLNIYLESVDYTSIVSKIFLGGEGSNLFFVTYENEIIDSLVQYNLLLVQYNIIEQKILKKIKLQQMVKGISYDKKGLEGLENSIVGERYLQGIEIAYSPYYLGFMIASHSFLDNDYVFFIFDYGLNLKDKIFLQGVFFGDKIPMKEVHQSKVHYLRSFTSFFYDKIDDYYNATLQKYNKRFFINSKDGGIYYNLYDNLMSLEAPTYRMENYFTDSKFGELYTYKMIPKRNERTKYNERVDSIGDVYKIRSVNGSKDLVYNLPPHTQMPFEVQNGWFYHLLWTENTYKICRYHAKTSDKQCIELDKKVIDYIEYVQVIGDYLLLSIETNPVEACFGDYGLFKINWKTKNK